jgi:hypothetical protein
MTQEVLKLALDALIWTTGSGDFGEGGYAHEGAKKCLFPAITAIKEALALQALHDENERLGLYKEAYAQPEQEPVADDFFRMIANRNPKPFPSPQRTWVGLTADEVFEICNSLYNRDSELVEMVEAKLKKKNT